MRSPLTFLLLVLSTFVFSQQKKFTLSVKTDDKGSVHGFSYWRWIEVYDGDPLVTKAAFNKKGVKFDSLSASNYIVTARSVFGHYISKSVNLQKDEVVTISLKKWNKKTSPKSFSQQLARGESMYILHNTLGKAPEKIRLQRNLDGDYYAELISLDDDSVVTAKLLSAEAVELIAKTEKEAAKFNKSSGCTSIETYTFWCKGKYFCINDGTCCWNAWAKLKKSFFQN